MTWYHGTLRQDAMVFNLKTRGARPSLWVSGLPTMAGAPNFARGLTSAAKARPLTSRLRLPVFASVPRLGAGHVYSIPGYSSPREMPPWYMVTPRGDLPLRNSAHLVNSGSS
jgi:hypothetical protein